MQGSTLVYPITPDFTKEIDLPSCHADPRPLNRTPGLGTEPPV